jgi:predicted nucleic acid-binding protein
VPNEQLMAWIGAANPEHLYVSVLTLGELRKGVFKLGAGRQRERLSNWLDTTLADWFGERVIAIDLAVADRWAQLLADAGRPLPAIDSLIAATALHRGLAIVTRNVRDFAMPGVEVMNPWDGA